MMDHDEYQQIMPKISGYLEKKGRTRMVSCYKKYWFVLKGGLLLYYKSKDEYNGISPCKGSINLGPTCSIKPSGSNKTIFQIESKTMTITLRAETKEEQHKWMEALMSALKQKNDFRNMNHFRHSVGELSPAAKKNPLERNHTLPDRIIPYPTDCNMSVIAKLQKMGAKSYGIGPNLPKATLERQKHISFSDESLPSSSNNFRNNNDSRFSRRESIITENEEYGKLDPVRRSNSIESIDATSSDGIYERIPSSDSVFITSRELLTKPIATNRETFMQDNDIYWSRCAVQKINLNPDYCYEAIDYNENTMRRRTRAFSEGFSREENAYTETEIQEHRNTGGSAEYADIEPAADYEDGVQYTEIGPATKSSLSSQESNQDKDKPLFAIIGKKKKSPKQKSINKERKLHKSESFFQRVWPKKSKNKKTPQDISLSTNNIAEKIDVTDDVAFKTLSELHELLKKQQTIVKLHETKHVRQGTTESEEESEVFSNKMHLEENNGRGACQTEVQIKAKPRCPSLPPRNQKDSSSEVAVQPPLVPPKMKKRLTATTSLDEILHDLDTQSVTIEKPCQKDGANWAPKINKDDNKEGKVKELIKRFSIGKEEGVELRQKSNKWKLKTETSATSDSKELDMLLDELAKVTTAPIMTPGVTTSLINPEISDKEILELRRRRLSDPDYDVPRPHRSLTNLPKKDDNALEATRFFGPILKPSDFESESMNRPPTPPVDYHSNLPSITPDSLEVDCRKRDLSHDELRTASFESHDYYLSFNKASHHNLDFLVDPNLYAHPKLLLKSGNEISMSSEGTSLQRLEESDSRFIDSLEP